MRNAILLGAAAAVLSVIGVSSSSCGGGGGGGTGGGSGGGSANGGGSAGGFTETADADAGICTSTALAPCTTYVDATAASASRVVNFGTDGGFNSDPECLKIKSGQSVTFHTGPFHPIVQDCGPVNRKLVIDMTTDKSLTFGATGDYMYECGIHAFPGFIKVVP